MRISSINGGNLQHFNGFNGFQAFGQVLEIPSTSDFSGHAGSKQPWGSHWPLPRSGYESLYPGWLKKQVGSLFPCHANITYGQMLVNRWAAPTGIAIAGMICKLCSMSWQRSQSQLLARRPWERSWTLRSIARSSKTFGTCTATSTGASQLGLKVWWRRVVMHLQKGNCRGIL